MCKTVLLFDWFINVFLILRTFCNCAKIIFSVTRKGENCTKFSLCDKGRLVTSHSAITGPFVWDINVTVYTWSAPDSNPGLLRLSCLNVWLGAGGSRHRLQGVLEGVIQNTGGPRLQVNLWSLSPCDHLAPLVTSRRCHFKTTSHTSWAVCSFHQISTSRIWCSVQFIKS